MPSHTNSKALVTLTISILLLSSTALSQVARRPAELQNLPAAVAQDRVVATQNRAVLDSRVLTATYGNDAVYSRYDARTGQVDRVSAAAITLTKDQYLAVSGGNVSTEPMRVAGQTFNVLPTVIVKLNADGTRQFLRIGEHTEGLYWQPQSQNFLAELIIAVFDQNNPSARTNLEPQIPVQLTGPPGSITQSLVRINKLGTPGKKTSVVTSEGGDSLPVTIHSHLEPTGKRTINIPLMKPKLELSASPPTIDGFGLQSTHVSLAPVDGPGPGPGLTFTLHYSDGKPVNDILVTNAAGSVYYTDFWSTGIGNAALSIQDSRFEISLTNVNFRTPYAFLIATIIGALLGATALVFWYRSKDPGKPYIWSWLASLTFGVGVVMVVYAGFRLPQVPGLPDVLRNARVVPFGLAFLSAFFMAAIVASFGKKPPDADSASVPEVEN